MCSAGTTKTVVHAPRPAGCAKSVAKQCYLVQAGGCPAHQGQRPPGHGRTGPGRHVGGACENSVSRSRRGGRGGSVECARELSCWIQSRHSTMW